MGIDGWITITAFGVILFMLSLTRIGPELIMLSALIVLIAFNVIDADDALIGLTNKGMITVAVLYIVAAGLKETGGVSMLLPHLLGKAPSIFAAQLKIVLPISCVSAFLNNTPVVAMFIPMISDWAKKYGLPVSKLMIPLSYAAIFGGLCTLIGTSTNLVVNGMLMTYAQEHGLDSYAGGIGMFAITPVGVTCALAGIVYLLIFSRWLLPNRRSFSNQISDPRKYTVEMLVEPESPLVGKTIEEAGLRQLPSTYLMEIDRSGELLVAVSPKEKLHANDRLVFVGIVDSVLDLQKTKGLTPAADQVFKLDVPRSQRCLIEAVVSNSCPLIGMTVKEGRFRSRYNAVIIAIARNGQRISKKIGDIVLQSGDTLLLEARPSFAVQQYNSRDFYLISKIEDSSPPRFERAWIALSILAGMILVAALGWMNILTAAIIAAGLMVATDCCSWSTARKSIDWQVLLVIIAAFGLGRALQTTGAADKIAGSLIGLAGDNPWLTLAIVYGITSAFTAIITNNAAAVLFLPVAMAAAEKLGVNYMPFIISVMVGASASFATPIGYQTNLMVYGPGGYRFSDYVRIGLPLNLIIWAITVTLSPVIWPF